MGKVASLPVAQPTNSLLMPLEKLIHLPHGTLLRITKQKDSVAIDYICPYYGYDKGNVFSNWGYVQIDGQNIKFEFIGTSEPYIMGYYSKTEESVTSDFFAARLASEEEKRLFWDYYNKYEKRLWTMELNSIPKGMLLTISERCKIETGAVTSTMICEFDHFDSKTDQISVGRCVRFIEKKGADTVVEVTNYDGTTFYFKRVERIMVTIDDDKKKFEKYVVRGRPYEKVSFQIHNEIEPVKEVPTLTEGYISPCHMKTFVTKVLVCNGEGKVWRPAIFGYQTKDNRVCTVGGSLWTHCLNYRNHRDLVGVKFKKEHLNG